VDIGDVDQSQKLQEEFSGKGLVGMVLFFFP
jgi:hypothetical protein